MGSEYSYWESRNITEPWIFIQHGSVPLGVCWPKTHRVHIESWCINLEASLGSLGPGEKSATEPIHLTIGGYTDWTRFRAFAMQEPDIRSDLRLTDPIELILNRYNPVLQSNLNVTLQDHRLVQRRERSRFNCAGNRTQPSGSWTSMNPGLRNAPFRRRIGVWRSSMRWFICRRMT